MDVKKSQRVPLLHFSALWHCSKISFFSEIFLKISEWSPFFSYFTTNWSFTKPKGSPILQFWASNIAPTLAVPALFLLRGMSFLSRAVLSLVSHSWTSYFFVYHLAFGNWESLSDIYQKVRIFVVLLPLSLSTSCSCFQVFWAINIRRRIHHWFQYFHWLKLLLVFVWDFLFHWLFCSAFQVVTLTRFFIT